MLSRNSGFLAMERPFILDLLGVISPVCLLKCKNALNELSSGEVLEVLVEDPEVVESLSVILKQSQDQVEGFLREGDHFRISIRKGETKNESR